MKKIVATLTFVLLLFVFVSTIFAAPVVEIDGVTQLSPFSFSSDGTIENIKAQGVVFSEGIARVNIAGFSIGATSVNLKFGGIYLTNSASFTVDTISAYKHSVKTGQFNDESIISVDNSSLKANRIEMDGAKLLISNGGKVEVETIRFPEVNDYNVNIIDISGSGSSLKANLISNEAARATSDLKHFRIYFSNNASGELSNVYLDSTGSKIEVKTGSNVKISSLTLRGGAVANSFDIGSELNIDTISIFYGIASADNKSVVNIKNAYLSGSHAKLGAGSYESFGQPFGNGLGIGGTVNVDSIIANNEATITAIASGTLTARLISLDSAIIEVLRIDEDCHESTINTVNVTESISLTNSAVIEVSANSVFNVTGVLNATCMSVLEYYNANIFVAESNSKIKIATANIGSRTWLQAEDEGIMEITNLHITDDAKLVSSLRYGGSYSTGGIVQIATLNSSGGSQIYATTKSNNLLKTGSLSIGDLFTAGSSKVYATRDVSYTGKAGIVTIGTASTDENSQIYSESTGSVNITNLNSKGNSEIFSKDTGSSMNINSIVASGNSHIYTTSGGTLIAGEAELSENAKISALSNNTISVTNSIIANGGIVNVEHLGTMNAGSAIINENGLFNLYGTYTGNATTNGTGLLIGNGVINGNLVNNGVVKIDNTFNTTDKVLNIDGDYSQSSDGILEVKIWSETDTTYLDISGNATIADGALIRADFSEYAPVEGEYYKVLVAKTYSLTGNFRAISIVPGYRLAVKIYDDGINIKAIDPSQFNDFIVYLTLVPITIDDILTMDLTYNQTQVALNIKKLVEDSKINKPKVNKLDEAYGMMTGLYGAEYYDSVRDVLDSLSGVIHTATLTMHLKNPAALVFDQLQRSDITYTGKLKWVSPVIQISNYAYDGNAKAFDEIYVGITAGAQSTISKTSEIGYLVGLGYSVLKQNFLKNDIARSIDIEAGIYGSTSFKGLIAKGYFGYGVQSVWVDRIVYIENTMNENLKAKYITSDINLQMELAYDINNDRKGIMPFVGVDYLLMMRRPFEETGDESLSLSVERTRLGYLDAKIGIRYVLELDSATISMAAAYKYMFGKTYTQMDASFDEAYPYFNVRGVELGNHVLNVNIDSRFVLKNTNQLTIKYNGEFMKNGIFNSLAIEFGSKF